jgi:prolyl 4-hydroxylase
MMKHMQQQKNQPQKAQETLDEWLKSQIARGCSLESMVQTMQQSGYSAVTARSTVIKAFHDADLATSASPNAATIAAWQNIKQTIKQMAAKNHQPMPQFQPVISISSPRVMVFDKLLSDTECDSLIALSEAKMYQSTVVDPATGQHVPHPERISRGTHLEHQTSDVVKAIEARITQLFGFALNQQEAIQILHYQVGGEYKPHYDFFPPADAGSQAAIAQAGQRLATLIMYLNTPTAGGTTDLPNIGLSVTAKKGSAVYFENIAPDGNPDNYSLHAGMPVLAGEKWIATKWLRERNLF